MVVITFLVILAILLCLFLVHKYSIKKKFYQKLRHYFIMSDNEDIPDGQMENGHLAIEYAGGMGDAERVSDNDTDVDDNDNDGSPSSYDVALPTWHRYLGKLENVSGYTMYDDNEIVTLPAIRTNTLVFPGFTLPLVINNDLEVDMLQRHTKKSSCFVLLVPKENFYGFFNYGTIMEIFETHLRDNVLYLKAKSRQRCKLIKNEKIKHLIGDLYEVTVKVLEEPRLTSPIQNTQLISLKKNRPYITENYNNLNLIYKYRKYHLSQYPLASWLYDKHEICFLLYKLLNGLKKYYIMDIIPQNPTILSYWFVQNFQLRHCERLRLLMVSSTIERLRLELQYLNMKRLICCANCETEIAKQSDVFAMSKDGVQSNYCNPGGHVFETVTVSKAINFQLIGVPSAQFSWFPGYYWTIIQCKICNAHLGWRFTSKNLKPECFYGLAKSGFDVKIVKDEEELDA